jgi:flagellar motor switch/type III secretory pathway protein FliN
VKRLTFGDGPGTRWARFVDRSLLPVSAACLVANAMRERLCELCAAEVDLRLWPPAIPQPAAWATLLQGARIFVVRGSRSDAAIVLREYDACALGALLFGEATPPGKNLAPSPLEEKLTRRAVAELVPALACVCGQTRLDSAGSLNPITYFELHLVSPIPCAIGIALSREPESAVTVPLPPAALHDALVNARVEVAVASMPARAVAALREGDVLCVDGSRGVLVANGCAIGRGACGVVADRFALRFEGGRAP